MKNLRLSALLLIVLGLLISQTLIGGARMVFALPGYLVLAMGGLLLVFAPTPSRGALRQNLCLTAGLLFAFYIILRSRFSPVEYVARADFYMALAALIVYWATAQYFREVKARLIIIIVLLGAAVAHTLVGVIQFKFSPQFMLLPGIMRPTEMSYGWRASGFYIYPSHLAGLLEMVGLSALALCCWARWKPWVRLLVGHGAAICFVGLALTGSRGGYVSALAGLVIFALLSFLIMRRVHPERTGLMIAAISATFCGLLGACYFFMADSTVVAQRLDQIYEPENGRILLWATALDQFRLAPFLGTGSGTYLFFGRLLRSPAIQSDPVHVHSDYLELLAEYGLLGLGCATAFLALHLASGFSGLRQILAEKLRPGAPPASNEMALVTGALAGLGAVLVHSAIDFNFHLPANTLVAAFLFGILAGPRLAGESSVFAPALRRSAFALATALPAGILVWFTIATYPAELLGEKARVALRDHHYPDAWGLAERALAYDSRNPYLHFQAAQAQHFLTQGTTDPASRISLHESADNALEKALALSPHDTPLLLLHAQILDLLGRGPEAGAAYQCAIDADPNLGTLHAYHGFYWHRRQCFWLAQYSWLKASALGENNIAPRGLQELARLKKDSVLRSLHPDAFQPPLRPRTEHTLP
jgi:O-antigen ligase